MLSPQFRQKMFNPKWQLVLNCILDSCNEMCVIYLTDHHKMLKVSEFYLVSEYVQLDISKTTELCLNKLHQVDMFEDNGIKGFKDFPGNPLNVVSIQ